MKSYVSKFVVSSIVAGLLSFGLTSNAVASDKVDVIVKFYKMHVKSNSEGRAGSHTGEFSIDLDVSGSDKTLRKNGVRDNSSYSLNETFYIENHQRNKPISIRVYGREIDSGNWYSNGGNDFIGEFSRKHAVRSGTHAVWSSTKHFKLYYKIKVID